MGSFRVLVERRRADPITAEFLSVASSAIRLRALRFSPFRDHGRSAQSRNRPVPGGTAFAVRSLWVKGRCSRRLPTRSAPHSIADGILRRSELALSAKSGREQAQQGVPLI